MLTVTQWQGLVNDQAPGEYGDYVWLVSILPAPLAVEACTDFLVSKVEFYQHWLQWILRHIQPDDQHGYPLVEKVQQ